MITKIQIKNRYTGGIIFEYECEDNSIRKTVEEAVMNKKDLYVADLREANLGGAKNVPYIPLECPSDGAFTGWKKVCGCIIELQIPADAKRSSATTRRCRCDKAKVISIKDEEGNDIEGIVNTNYTKTAYKVGGMVYPDSFDENRFNECSHGIHFFINKQDAIDY